MRITADEKQATRRRIVEAALDEFRIGGFATATTRDIARRAGIATGTLFNYFATKEAIVADLVAEALAKARAAFTRQAPGTDLEEDLFALAAVELRQLKPLRKLVAALFDDELSPLATPRTAAKDTIRAAHLELVWQIARKHGVEELSPFALQMYWALYTGVLAFWAADRSAKQEDTLALLDQSLHMFAAWLQDTAGRP